jgi:hypothetical protein
MNLSSLIGASRIENDPFSEQQPGPGVSIVRFPSRAFVVIAEIAEPCVDFSPQHP